MKTNAATQVTTYHLEITNETQRAYVKDALAQETTAALVAYFNIMRFPCLGAAGNTHLPVVIELLTERGHGSAVESAIAAKKPLVRAA